MYNKKYRLEKIEEFNKHNPIYDDIMGKICYPAYFNIGERGWFLYIEDGLFIAHRLHTSVIENVIYANDGIVVVTQNTKFAFKLVD